MSSPASIPPLLTLPVLINFPASVSPLLTLPVLIICGLEIPPDHMVSQMRSTFDFISPVIINFSLWSCAHIVSVSSFEVLIYPLKGSGYIEGATGKAFFGQLFTEMFIELFRRGALNCFGELFQRWGVVR